MSDAANDQNCCIVCGSSQHGNWECKPEQAPREQKIQWFERAWVMINLDVIAVLSRGLSHGLVTEIERLRERAKQNIDAKYEIGRMLGCPEHEELLPWIVRYRDEHKRLSDEITRLRREGNGRMWEQECREKDAEIERLRSEIAAKDEHIEHVTEDRDALERRYTTAVNEFTLEIAAKDARIEELDKAYDQVSQRLNGIIRRNHRLTKLLRSALPEQRAIGCGLEGMIQSLLAIAVSGERIDGHIIANSQIDAAWEMAHDKGLTPVAREMARRCLKKLGIERCDCLKWEHINGVCQNCNGHKWVIGGDDE